MSDQTEKQTPHQWTLNTDADKPFEYQHPWCNRAFTLKEEWGKRKLASLCCLLLCENNFTDCSYCRIETELSEENVHSRDSYSIE
ncbi:MAG: hypothetical protein V1915_05140 [Candidatus Bathyarchaeota archaeon]